MAHPFVLKEDPATLKWQLLFSAGNKNATHHRIPETVSVRAVEYLRLTDMETIN
jgi:hypothetical protein